MSMIYLFEWKKNKFLTQKHTDFFRVCNLKELKQIIHSFQTYVHGHYNDIWDTCIFLRAQHIAKGFLQRDFAQFFHFNKEERCIAFTSYTFGPICDMKNILHFWTNMRQESCVSLKRILFYFTFYFQGMSLMLIRIVSLIHDTRQKL